MLKNSTVLVKQNLNAVKKEFPKLLKNNKLCKAKESDDSFSENFHDNWNVLGVKLGNCWVISHDIVGQNFTNE